MRTTVDLPDDLRRIASAIAHNSGLSPSDTIAHLLRAALHLRGPVQVTTSPRTGLRVATMGGVVTSEDVRPPDDRG